jgi:outer membrane protein assembly factor BamB
VALDRGIVYFTGGFTAVGGRPRHGIAAARAANGRVVAEFAPTGSCAAYGHAIAAADGRVFVGGDACRIAAFAASSGTQLWAWPRHVDATTNVLLAVSGRVYVGGAFRRLAGAGANGLAALDARTGRPVATWHPGPGSEIFALSASDGRILIGADQMIDSTPP